MPSSRNHNGARSAQGQLTLAEAAGRAGVAPATLRRWVSRGMIPMFDGVWTPPVIAHARIIARMRERGYSLQEIQRATDEGKLAYGYVEGLFPIEEGRYTLKDGARETGLDPALVERVMTSVGVSIAQADSLSEEDVQLLRYVAAVLEAGLPLVALLQLVRVYGQAMAQVADAEVRLFHLYVHEPLMRSGASGIETADEMLSLSRELLPLASPVMDQVHQRYLQHFVEQDVIGHMESDLAGEEVDLGRLRVVIALVEHAGPHLEFERIAEVKLKGFSETTEIFLAHQREEE
jgi:adenylate cyclase